MSTEYGEKGGVYFPIQDRNLYSQRLMAFFNWYLCTLWGECEPLWEIKKLQFSSRNKHSRVEI